MVDVNIHLLLSALVNAPICPPPSPAGNKNCRLEKKKILLARLLLDFGTVNAMDNDCEQHVPTVALCLQQLTTPAV